ncbi:MAG TPA: tetratricopeptide repeat protein [Candidatus Eisenbacteria bacterium]|nr:tetratricopeptide repeat protein [Candidatus Eisenbacteria bacterium]
MKRGTERRSPKRKPPQSSPGRVTPPPDRMRTAPLPLGHPAWLLALAAAATAVLVSVTFVIYEKDFWQHVAVGRALWRLGHVPDTQIWTWPTYGEPAMTPSWGFRLLIWPVWQAGGVLGLYGWRWLTTLLVFGLAFVTARRMGARGMAPVIVLVLCALTYRQRSQIRPETLASVWLACTIALLEWRRVCFSAERLRALQAWRDPALLLAPLLWVWINTHLSYPLGFVVALAYVVDAQRTRRPGSLALWRAIALATLVIFLNPYGVASVLEPFRFFTGQRDEPIFRIIPELLPLDLGRNLTNLLPLVLFGWPALQIARLVRRRGDLAEGILAVFFIALAFSSQRFLAFAMVVAAPFMARDLDAWLAPRRLPGALASPTLRAVLTAALCLALGLADWRRPEFPIGIGLRNVEYPIAACDFIAREGVRGRSFNHFYLGGYLLERFWPDRARLPFMDIHQTGAREDRDLYAFAMNDLAAWRELDRRHRFEWVLLRRTAYAGDLIVEHLDADTSFALVFMDDAAALWVRKAGALSALAARFAYRELSAGTARLAALGAAATSDSTRRASIVAELEREAAGSPYHAQALGRLGSLDLAVGDLAAAEKHLRGALASDPFAPRAHERLGLVALALGRPKEALEHFELERRNGPFPREQLALGRAWQALGDRERARTHYRRELEQDPGNAEASDSLAALDRR